MAQTGAAHEDVTGAGGWSPLSLQPPRPALLGLRMRIALMSSVIVLHVLAILWLLPFLDPRPKESQQALQANFIRAVPPPEPVIIEFPDFLPEPEPSGTVRPAPVRSSQGKLAGPAAAPSPSPSAKTEKLDLYGSDGRLKLPADLLDQIDRKYGDKRVFSYQVPRMDEGAKLWNRPPPVIYEDTRFAQYWKPDQDILTALLTEMVEKTTKEVRMKLPGRSNSTVVCRVSLLAFGGGCGVLTPGSDYVGPVDDPNTLSPDEDRQCQAWWEQIVSANTQDVWRRTRKLYEESCRKPLERKPAG